MENSILIERKMTMKTKQKVEPTQIEKEQLEVKSFFKCIAPSIADFRQSYYDYFLLGTL